MSKRKVDRSALRAEKTSTRPTPASALAEVRAAMEQRAARQERRQQIQAAALRRRRLTRLRATVLLVLGLLLAGGLFAATAGLGDTRPGQAVGQQPSPHVPRSDTPYAFYTTDPPTSGPHVNQVPPWGVATTPVPKEVQVHALEDGGVLIHYQPTLNTKTLEKLTALTARYEAQVLLNPAPDLAQAIVVTAWGRMLRFPTYDELGIQRFIESFRGQDHHLDSGS